MIVVAAVSTADAVAQAEDARASAAAVPKLITIAEAISDSNGDTIPDRLGKRVHVRGVVTIGSGVISDDRLQVYFQDDTAGMYLYDSSVADSVPAGSVIDVVGVLNQYRGSIQVGKPQIRIVGRQPLPQPVALTVKEAASWRYYGRLATVEGVLGEASEQGPYIGYDLTSNRATTRVLLPPSVSRQISIASIAPGTPVTVTGVISIYSTAPPHQKGFQIVVGSPSWIGRGPAGIPRWIRQGAIFAGIALLTIAAAIVGAKWFRRRVAMRRRQVTALNTLAAMAAAAVDGESFISDAIQLITRTGVTDGTLVHLLEGRHLTLRASYGIESDKARLVDEEIQSRIGRTMTDGEFSMEEPVTLQGSGTHLYPLICVPLQGRSRTLGVLTGFTATRHALTPGEAGVIAAAANLIALGVENVQILHENERKQRDLEELAVCDPLTGLYNRRFLDEYLRIHMAMARRQNAPISFIAIDLDHFKNVNDTYGHEAGDQVLSEMGVTIRNTVRASDLPVRVGGEEFLVVMPDTSEAGAVTFAIRLQANLRERRYRALPEDARVTASIGIALYPDDGDSVGQILRAADASLYESKSAGRDRITVRGAPPIFGLGA